MEMILMGIEMVVCKLKSYKCFAIKNFCFLKLAPLGIRVELNSFRV